MAKLEGCDFCKFLNYESSDDFYLYEVGTTACKPSYSYEHFVNKRTIIHFILRGKGTVTINGVTNEVKGHQAFIIPEGHRASYRADDKDPWEYVWFHIGGPKFPQLLKEAGLSHENPIFKPTKHWNEIEELVNDIVKNYKREYYCIGKIYEICDYMIHFSPARNVSEVDNSLMYVKKAIAFIQLKYDEPIKVEHIAYICGLNRSYLTRLFKSATGYSLQEYLLSYRIKCAIKLLEKTDKSIQDIAYEVGYTDYFTFAKAFKRQTGKAPREYRK